MTKRVLVFGATGEIGGRVAAQCARAGYEVIGVSRGVSQEHHVDLNGVALERGDKNDEGFVREIASGRAFDAVIDTIPTLGNMKLYHRCFHEVENIITCSSTGTFVPLQYFPADEWHPWREETESNKLWYPQSVRDAWALDRHAEDGFPISILRPTCIIGRGRIPLDLWGGRCLDFWRLLQAGEPVAVPEGYEGVLLQAGCNEDLASAFFKAVGKGQAIHGELFIISCRRAITLKQYLETASEFLNSDSPIDVVSRGELMERYGDRVSLGGLDFLLEHMCFDIGKAERMLGYDPQYTAEDGLIEALRYCQRNTGKQGGQL